MKKVTRKSLKKRLIQIVVVGIVLSFLTLLTPLYAQSEPIVYVAHAEDIKIESINEKIIRISKENNVNPWELKNIIACETGDTFDPTIQSRNYIGGIREKSFGLAQINLTVHDVTMEQATDPDFSINFLAKNWSKGYRSMWYNCSKKYGYL